MNTYLEEKKKKAARNQKTLRFVLMGVLFLLVILLALAVAIVRIYQTAESEENYSAMGEATLPTVTLSYAGRYETELHGYLEKMNLTDMRDVIVPVGADKTLNVRVNAYGNAFQALSYEIRSLDGTTFVDTETARNLLLQNGAYETAFILSDLLESGTEYHLILELDTGERTVRFYSRILYAKTMYAEELLKFCTEFSESTRDPARSAFIVNYIQPEDDSQNTDYAYTNIHSKYAMFTFSSQAVNRTRDILYRISEFEPTQISVLLQYEVSITADERARTFKVQEFFCARIRSKKVYLLDYYRTLDEIYSPENSTEEKGRILLGVGASDISVMNSDDNVFTVFKKDREIWSYNAKTNSMNLVFSFASDNDPSTRSSYDHHDVEVVKVLNDGSIDFMVYGYMNRGYYEGTVGICFYRFQAAKNATTRLFYMPVTQSELLLMMDLGTLAYVNDQDVCYLRYGDGIYSIDLKSGESVEVTRRAYPGMYAKNKKGNVVAWQEGTDLTYPDRLVILNMDTQTTLLVNAEEGKYIKLLDFNGDDIIYGFGYEKDSVILANTDINQLLHEVVIARAAEGLPIRERYETGKDGDDRYILSLSVHETRLVIRLVKKMADRGLTEVDSAVLLITHLVSDESDKSMVASRSHSVLKKEYYIQVGRSTNTDSEFSVVSPRFEVLKEVNVIRLLHNQENVYYVYGYGRVLYVESEINVAISEADKVFGTVVNENMDYIWTRGTRDLVKTISIQPFVSDDPDNTLGAAIRVLSAQEGIRIPDVEAKLAGGKTPLRILDEAIGDGRALNLYGCTLQEALYFVNAGHPVLAITGDRKGLVITGYDTESVCVFDPEKGVTEEMPEGEAAVYFEALNRFFISYK